MTFSMTLFFARLCHPAVRVRIAVAPASGQPRRCSGTHFPCRFHILCRYVTLHVFGVFSDLFLFRVLCPSVVNSSLAAGAFSAFK
jgi:hypothetical protein